MSRARVLADRANQNTLAVDTTNSEVGIASTVPNATLDVRGEVKIGTAVQLGVAGVVTATSFSGSGSNLTGLATTETIRTDTLTVAGVSTFTGALNATSVVSSGAVSGTTGTFSGAVNVDATTDSTSSTSGALIVDGGLGVAKNVYIGAGLSVAGTLTYEDVTNVDSVGLITAKSGVNVSGGQLAVGVAYSVGAAGVATAAGFVGPLTGAVTGNADTATTATTATNVTVTANNSTDETVYPIFVDGATGSQGAESDTGLTYNPSDGNLTSTTFTGNVTGNVTGNQSGGSVSATTGTFSDDVTVTGSNKKFISNSSNSGDYVRVYAAGGTGKWDIYGNGADLRFSDNDSAGVVQFDTDVSIADKIVHTGDTNTAIRFPDADTVTVETANTERFRIGSNGYIGVGDFSSKSRPDPLNVDSGIGTVMVGGNYIHLRRYSGGNTNYINAPSSSGNLHISADDYVAFGVDHSGSIYSASTEAFRIDSSGRLLIGHTANLHDYKLQVLGADGNASLALSRFTNNSASSLLEFNKSRNGSVGSNTVVQDDDTVGVIRFKGADGTDYAQVADIQAQVDGTPGNNDMPGRLVFGTTADGSQYTTERLRIDSAGQLYARSNSLQYLVLGSTGSATSGGPNNDQNWIRSSGSNLNLNSASGGYISFETGGDERLRLTSSKQILMDGALTEKVKITAGKLSDNTNIDLENGMVHYFTTQETTTSTPNIRVNSSTSLNSIMTAGDVVSVTLVTTAAAGGYSANVNIDGVGVTEEWVGGAAPTEGGADGLDVYSYTIICTHASNTGDSGFKVIANLINATN